MFDSSIQEFNPPLGIKISFGLVAELKNNQALLNKYIF